MRAMAVLVLVAAARVATAEPVMKTERFDRDPGWDHVNNRPAERDDNPVTVRQDFGFSPTAHGGGKPGEVGGFISAAAEPAWYGKVIPAASLDRPLEASGTLAVADGSTHLLLGFFNADTAKEWRTANTIALRVNGRGDHFFAYLEYCTAKWRAGGDSPQSFPTARDPQSGRPGLVGFASGNKVHRWTLRYDPTSNGGAGSIRASIDGQTAVCDLAPEHRRDSATYNRFGILNVMKSADGGTEVFLDDITVNGQTETFEQDPKWDGRGNRATFETFNVRPRFDFGYSPTRFCGGETPGEMGGLFFRGDCRARSRMAYYGDRVGPLSLDRPIKASGKVALRRGVSDSTTLFGFFDAAAATRQNPSQNQALPEGVIGVNIEGPSSEGFCFYPVVRLPGRDGRVAPELRKLHIHPDGAVHDWAFNYDPAGAAGRGRLTVALDGDDVHLDLDDGDKARGAKFDHFGLVTPWIDGNGQVVYFDDLTYTSGQ